jgi:RNA polymerase sigma factor (sigma-70 family)
MSAVVRAARDFDTFFAGTAPVMLARAIMLCGNREDAEDAVQEAYVEAYRAWERIGGYESAEAWVHRVMLQRLWKQYRRRKTGRDRILDLTVPAQAAPEQTAEAREVLRLLAGLPPVQRMVMVLHCVQGWSQQEVARELRITRGAVASSVFKARHTLRGALGMAPDETGGARSPLLGRMGRIGLGRRSPAADPLATVLCDTEAWLRAAVRADAESLRRLREAVGQETL